MTRRACRIAQTDLRRQNTFGGPSFLCLWLVVWSKAKARIQIIKNSCRKQRKYPLFQAKSGYFVELLGGFEPPTSSLPSLFSLFFAVVLFCSLFCVSVAALGVHGLSSCPFPLSSGRFCVPFSGAGVSFGVSFIASRKICEARRRLSSLAWLYIRKVTAVSLWPRVSETLTTSAPLVMAMLAKVWRSLWGWKSLMPFFFANWRK